MGRGRRTVKRGGAVPIFFQGGNALRTILLKSVKNTSRDGISACSNFSVSLILFEIIFVAG